MTARRVSELQHSHHSPEVAGGSRAAPAASVDRSDRPHPRSGTQLPARPNTARCSRLTGYGDNSTTLRGRKQASQFRLPLAEPCIRIPNPSRPTIYTQIVRSGVSLQHVPREPSAARDTANQDQPVRTVATVRTGWSWPAGPQESAALPLLDLRQVALGNSGEPSKRVPRYVREFSLGAQVPAGVGQLAGSSVIMGPPRGSRSGWGTRNATGPGAGRAPTCRASGSIGRQ